MNRTAWTAIVALGLVQFQKDSCSTELREAPVMKFVGIVVEEAGESARKAYLMSVSIDLEARVVTYDGVQKAQYRKCDDDMRICIWESQITFAVPKDWSLGVSRWKFREVDFRVIDCHGSLERESPSCLIEAIHARGVNPVSYYVYSPLRGLTAFRVYMSGVGGQLVPVSFARTE